MPEVLTGAKPYAADGGTTGVLVVHGFSASPQSVRPWGEALAAAGHTVRIPRLPGHGTSVEDFAASTWSDWLDAATAAYRELEARCEAIVVAGLSMGGALACALAAQHSSVRGLALVNPAVEPPPPEVRDQIRSLMEAGTAAVPGLGSDIADPEQEELAYAEWPLAALLSLFELQEKVATSLSSIRCPVLLFTSRDDHVVATTASDLVERESSGPVDRVWLERSFHVATLDHDRHLIAERTLEFVERVVS